MPAPGVASPVVGGASANIATDDIRTRRHRVGLSQQQLAVAAECSLSAVRLFERGYTPQPSPTRDRVVRVLDKLEANGKAAA